MKTPPPPKAPPVRRVTGKKMPRRNAMIKLKDQLAHDQMIYGVAYVQLIKPNFFGRMFRRIMNLPVDRKRLNPKTIRIGQLNLNK